MSDSPTFAEILDGYMRRMKLGAHRLGKETGVPKQTIEGWLRGKKPRDWKMACQIAQTLGLSSSEIDAFLTAAGQPSVESLVWRAQCEQDMSLLARWVGETLEQEQGVGNLDMRTSRSAATGQEAADPRDMAGARPDIAAQAEPSRRARLAGPWVMPGAVVATLTTLILIGLLLVVVLGRTPPAPASIVDTPNDNIASVQFDYDPAYYQGSLRLRLCVKSEYARIKSEEIAPNPRILVDQIFHVERECEFKYPVIALMIGDIEEISIGAGETAEIETMRLYRITRTKQGLEGGFVREIGPNANQAKE